MTVRDKNQPSLDIVVAADVLSLKGTGQDVNAALLSGNVVLFLNEPTSLKHITLQFRGKAKIPASPTESIPMQSTQVTYIVCNHEWSFLEGAKGHSHTLKAGRHLFPFQLHIGGTLPSSLDTTALGGASISYKLRATAARAGFSFSHRDIHAEKPIYLMRSLAAEALEYQQTLEIENTWPEKLMYSIMIPHKAWAAGDRVTAVVKFSPLIKGARVLNVTTSINESLKIHGRTGVQEVTRAIATTRHDIVEGQAIPCEEQHHRYRVPLLSGSSPGHRSGVSSPTSAGSYFPQQTSSPNSTELTPLSATSSNDALSASVPNSAPTTGSGNARSSTSATAGVRYVDGVEIPYEPGEEPSQDVMATLNIGIPAQATPSHNLEPIVVSHRIRWSIMIANRDGHTSELRCSLPLQVLDHRLLDEARASTLATRRLILGAADVEGGQAVGTHGPGNDFDAEDDMELPSYPAHVRDRVANVFLPETGVLRVTNPWIAQGISPVISYSEVSSGIQSPLETYPVGQAPPQSQLPANPTQAGNVLDWVNSELLLSLSEHPEIPQAPEPRRSRMSHRTPPSEADIASATSSLFGSRRGSRTNSPDRNSNGTSTHGPAGSHPAANSSTETFVHSSSTASRHSHGLFHISMKPFTSLTSGFGLGSRNNSHGNLQSHCPHGHSHLAHSNNVSSSPSGQSGARSQSSSGTSSPGSVATVPISSQPQVAPMSHSARTTTMEPVSGPMLLHRAFTQTPDYEMASRGFLGGGVPPLDAMRGLPSYADAAAEGRSEAAESRRSSSDSPRGPERERGHDREHYHPRSQTSPPLST
ncbi:hypothetical protein EUX98_g5798 [Antrodiella citrinella]|uniref:Arrestin C-terminal-like domain-containing protein n=1 Tax=Antrodiella citrinella TaxID=2447956 RepID=A0A4S4MT61_9APHY|nr:hypothetical protein EUX98_g5798 [Antrodiella citrinella]